MNRSGAAPASSIGDCRADLWVPSTGVAYLEAWRAAVRPFPGSVPPFAGFVPIVGTEPSPDGDIVGAAVASAVAAIGALRGLCAVDPSDADPVALTRLVEGVEQIRRVADAAATQVAGAIDVCNPFRPQGYFTARIEPAVLTRDAGMLLDDAVNLPFAEFERNLRTWEALADPVGDDAQSERARQRREFTLAPRPDGGWNLSGFLPEPSGAEFAEIFAWYVDAEWRLDWADARARLGDKATVADLVRTEPQRRADALLAMARASVSRDPDTARPPATSVTVDILLDHHTMEAHAAGTTPDPRRFRNVVCRTRSGRRLHPDDAVHAALIGHIRRAVYDQSGTIIDLGRRSRLFRGPSRDAVMLLLTTCVWIGCDRPVAWCDADHSLSWKAHGNTVPRNGQPLCTGHQNLKETGYQVFRDDHGQWHIVDPHGNELA